MNKDDILLILTLSNGKNVKIDGNSFNRDEAHEIIIKLTELWGTDFEKAALCDLALGIQEFKNAT